jgi:Ala-tRNA(Pro) deacylase
MSELPKRLTSFLEERGVDYEVIHHRRDFTAQQTAADTHTPGREFAKAVFLCLDGDYAMAVLPAHRKIDLEAVRAMLGVKEARLATEDEIERLCPDCEVGAAPPLGNLYDLPVYMSEELTRDEQITFNAGTHEDAIRMLFQDYRELAQPRLIDLG